MSMAVAAAVLRLVEHDVAEVDERVRDLGLSVGVVLSSEQQEVVDHPRHGEVLVGDVGCDRWEDVRVLVAERSARTS